MALNLFGRKKQETEPQPTLGPVVMVPPEPERPAPKPVQTARPDFEPAERVDYHKDALHRQLQLGRYGIILSNPQHWEKHRDIEAVYAKACEAIDATFALVPEGYASLPLTVDDDPGCPEEDYEVEPFLLATHAVTNAEYQRFVDVGAYDDLDLWPKEIWPHLIDFKDQTGASGPRFWRDGRHDRRLADHPVVGISYYEAAAYACWAGFRLPHEVEWQMAASWRIRTSANVLRRYPWGDAFDVRRCNVWASGVGHTVPVNAYENGAAPNGVAQLVGNVWEWCYSDFEIHDDQQNPVVGDMLMKSIRGGAFDTYFPGQATSCFRTGLASLVRAHNVGFRCVMDVPQE